MRYINHYSNPKYFFFLLSFLLSVPLYAETSMSVLLKKPELAYLQPCREKLVHVAETVIGKRKHRLLASEKTEAEQKGKGGQQRKQAAAGGGKVFYASGVLSYRDRDVHMGFTAVPSGKENCQVIAVKSFTVKEPCIAVREEVFKKWNYLGQLNPLTMVLQNKKQPAEQAMLSNQFMGKACLATTRWLH